MTTVAETVPATAGVNARGRSEHSERFYRPELDVLRFFAFLGVFIFHAAPRTLDFYDRAGYPHWLSSLLIPTFGAGAYGVDLFFALSAYLITSLLLRERAATGALDLRGFYLATYSAHMAAVSGVCSFCGGLCGAGSRTTSADAICGRL